MHNFTGRGAFWRKCVSGAVGLRDCLSKVGDRLTGAYATQAMLSDPGRPQVS